MTKHKLAEMGFAEPDDDYYSPKVQLDALEKLNKMGGWYDNTLNVNTNNVLEITIEGMDEDGLQDEEKS